jgi:hypothetical protein
MPFTITATNSAGAVSFARTNASDALKKRMELELSGFQKVTVKDNLGRSLTRDELILLAAGKS